MKTLCNLLGAILLVLAAALGGAPARAASAADASVVRQRLQPAPVVRGRFEQTKTIKGFRNGLVSHGEFLVARGQGVWWHTLGPFESTLVVTQTRLFTRAADGSTANVLDAQAEPGLRQVNELVFSLLSADLDALATRFDIDGQAVGATGWTLTLTPRDADVARFLAKATLTGDGFVQTVRIDETRGDSTRIRFTQQAPSAELSPADAARLR